MLLFLLSISLQKLTGLKTETGLSLYVAGKSTNTNTSHSGLTAPSLLSAGCTNRTADH